MKTVFLMTAFILFLSSTACFAGGTISAGIGGKVRFIYRQKIEVMSGFFLANVNVTDKIPHETKITGRGKDLVIL